MGRKRDLETNMKRMEVIKNGYGHEFKGKSLAEVDAATYTSIALDCSKLRTMGKTSACAIRMMLKNNFHDEQHQLGMRGAPEPRAPPQVPDKNDQREILQTEVSIHKNDYTMMSPRPNHAGTLVLTPLLWAIVIGRLLWPALKPHGCNCIFHAIYSYVGILHITMKMQCSECGSMADIVCENWQEDGETDEKFRTLKVKVVGIDQTIQHKGLSSDAGLLRALKSAHSKTLRRLKSLKRSPQPRSRLERNCSGKPRSPTAHDARNRLKKKYIDAQKTIEDLEQNQVLLQQKLQDALEKLATCQEQVSDLQAENSIYQSVIRNVETAVAHMVDEATQDIDEGSSEVVNAKMRIHIQELEKCLEPVKQLNTSSSSPSTVHSPSAQSSPPTNYQCRLEVAKVPGVGHSITTWAAFWEEHPLHTPLGFADLEEDKLEAVKAMFSDGPIDKGEKDVLVSQGGTSICIEELRTLLPCVWVDASICDAYLSLLVEHTNKIQPDSMYALSTDFWRELQNKTSGKEASTQRVKILHHKYILIPINIKNSHWVLVVVDTEDYTIQLLDSSILLDNEKERVEILEMIEKHLLEQVKSEGLPPPPKAWTREIPQVPQQNGKVDCGIFVLAFAIMLAMNQSINFVEQNNIIFYRFLIASEIIKKSIHH